VSINEQHVHSVAHQRGAVLSTMCRTGITTMSKRGTLGRRRDTLGRRDTSGITTRVINSGNNNPGDQQQE